MKRYRVISPVTVVGRRFPVDATPTEEQLGGPEACAGMVHRGLIQRDQLEGGGEQLPDLTDPLSAEQLVSLKGQALKEAVGLCKDPEVLGAAYDLEVEGQNRNTALKAIRDRLEEMEELQESSDDDQDDGEEQ